MNIDISYYVIVYILVPLFFVIFSECASSVYNVFNSEITNYN